MKPSPSSGLCRVSCEVLEAAKAMVSTSDVQLRVNKKNMGKGDGRQLTIKTCFFQGMGLLTLNHCENMGFH
jgi:hypothetical protein